MSAAESRESFNKRQQSLKAYTGCTAPSVCTVVMETHTVSAHNRHQGVKLTFCRIRIGFISKPKLTQILFNGAKVYTCNLKWDLQDKVLI